MSHPKYKAPEEYLLWVLRNLPTVDATENTRVHVGYERYRKYDIAIGVEPGDASRAPQILGVDTWTVPIEIGITCKDHDVLEAVKNEVLDLHRRNERFVAEGFDAIWKVEVNHFKDGFDEDEVDDPDGDNPYFSKCSMDIDWNRNR